MYLDTKGRELEKGQRVKFTLLDIKGLGEHDVDTYEDASGKSFEILGIGSYEIDWENGDPYAVKLVIGEIPHLECTIVTQLNQTPGFCDIKGVRRY